MSKYHKISFVPGNLEGPYLNDESGTCITTFGEHSDLNEELIQKMVDSYNACKDIKDPEKTIPELIDCINGLDELYGALMIEATELSSEVHDKLIVAQKALEGVSDE